MRQASEHIFSKNQNTVYDVASRFFPRLVRRDIVDIYTFARIARSYVTSPKNAVAMTDLQTQWQHFCRLPMAQLGVDANDTLNVRLAKTMARLKIAYQFDEAWLEAFFYSQQQALKRKTYRTMDETFRYMYGSSEVIGLMTAKVLRLPKHAMHAASMQARAIQYLLFLCNSVNDTANGLNFFPKSELAKYNLNNISKVTIEKQSIDFIAFVQAQLRLYNQWQQVADRGLAHVPKRTRAALLTAIDGYRWMAQQIEKDPLILTRRNIQPSKRRLLLNGLIHILD
ncbi:MAG TPA: squalene/phytoene synthase family protein [Candidatus Saccharimonadales bacterium]|jgi:phytoene synthase|nr:squalene/phytoene synthase family protein [Candidatus Saccharimonadales bacterium]